MNKLRLRAEGGFTLIELLVVIAIIGILAAIAIPQFAAYRKRGFVSQMESSLRNAATAQEAAYAQTQAYVNGALALGTPVGFTPTVGVGVTAAVPGADGTNQSFTLTSTRTDANCPGTTGTYQSTTGQITWAPVLPCP
jgi:prepilin-type N-terminal cleavage/methylation domain-containing protein